MWYRRPDSKSTDSTFFVPQVNQSYLVHSVELLNCRNHVTDRFLTLLDWVRNRGPLGIKLQIQYDNNVIVLGLGMIAYDGNNGFAARLHNEGWQIDCTLAAAPNGDGLMATFVAFSAS